MILLGVACLIGGFVGLYFSVLVLVPLTAALAFACCLGAAGHGDMISAALFSFIPAAFHWPAKRRHDWIDRARPFPPV